MVSLRISWGRWWWNERIVGRGRVEGIVIRVVGIGEMAIVVVYAGRSLTPRHNEIQVTVVWRWQVV